MTNVQALLDAAYGFAFPAEVIGFHEFMRTLRARANTDLSALGMEPGLVFEVFQSAPATPLSELPLRSRYLLDPPELFTVLHGDTDGLHWGYWIDDPGRSDFVVASFFENEAFSISIDGNDLFQAVRMHLERSYRDDLEYLQCDPDHAADYRQRLDGLDAIRAILREWGTGDRDERGADYVDRYQIDRKPTVPTIDGMGIMVPAGTYRPISGEERLADPERAASATEITRIVEAAARATAEGFPATALKVGKDLWPHSAWLEPSTRLLDGAYARLDRPVLRRMLALARAARLAARPTS
jgi:hypothetical protein